MMVALAGCVGPVGEPAAPDSPVGDSAVTTLVLPGVAIEVPGGSFERPALEPGGTTVSLPEGWVGSEGTIGGISRPGALMFASVEPLSAPADGRQCLYLLGGVGVPQGFAAVEVAPADGGATVHARAAIGGRLDVALPAAGVLEIMADGVSVASVGISEAELAAARGGFTQVGLSWQVPGAGEVQIGLRVGILASADDGVQRWLCADRLELSLE